MRNCNHKNYVDVHPTSQIIRKALQRDLPMNRVNGAPDTREFTREGCGPLDVVKKFRTKTSRALI
jgi:hypothetical protein